MPNSLGSKSSNDSSTVGINKELSVINVETPNKENDSLVESSEHGSSRGYDSSHGLEESTSSNERSDLSPALAAKESKQVLRSKILVYIVLLVSAATVAGFTYYFLSQEENSDFETQFTDFSTEILLSSETNAETYLGKLESLSDVIMSSAAATDAVWPNVTVKNFDILTTEAFEQFVGPELYLFAPVVSEAKRKEWEQYADDNQGWIREDLFLRGLQNINPGYIPDEIYSFYGDDESINEYRVPIWQVAPVPTNAEIVMLDLYTEPSFRRMIDDATTVRHILLSEVVDSTFLSNSIETLNKNPLREAHPRSYAVQPVFERFSPNQDADIAGFIFSVVPWDTYFSNILPAGTNNFIVQVMDTCDTNFTYRLNGADAVILDQGFVPDPKYDYLTQTAEFATFARFDAEKQSDGVLYCSYSLSVHATAEYEEEFKTNKPLWVTMIVVLVFVFTALVFVLYDFFVQRRQNKVFTTAQQTTAIVTSLFPKNVVKKMLEADNQKPTQVSGKDKLKNFFDSDDGGDGSKGAQNDTENGTAGGIFKTKPIADFFPQTTIMFGDIVGFTAWSSTREPSQVFILLETIYHEFDAIAKSRRVFKVETVGDCYVAVAGLPDPRKDHAMVMAKFARECLSTLSRLLRELEVSLGPDTADLAMRIGLHSGPVTAGVLRGDRARFQLFGDTMNTASRMESTGSPNRIQVSAAFAEHMKKANRSHWISQREELVDVKGKGSLQTYWLQFKGDNKGLMGETGSEPFSEGESKAFTDEASSAMFAHKEFKDQVTQVAGGTATDEGQLSQKVERLVGWNVDILTAILKQIVAQRESNGTVAESDKRLAQIENEAKDVPLDEVQEIITLPDFRRGRQCDPETIRIDDKVVEQLHTFIVEIARMYQQNPFHNFEHASHVTMSVTKLLARIVAPDTSNLGEEKMNERGLYDHTYGITSDPITQFSVILSALIHDADHPGVPNNQLIKEDNPLAKKYHEKSIAEQHSVDLAWSLLLTDDFKDLRRTIYKTEREFRRFRHLVVNTVLATDIMDKDLKQLRNNRWDKAFKLETEESSRDKKNRKATIVIEHLIQASDVAHTMQHWHIYRKWNARLFEEMYKAYLEGRAEKDPSEFWYKGEIGFLDFYIIPLAKKLKDCGVFGVSSDEYLQYAQNNRDEWEKKGKEVVDELIEKVKSNSKYQMLIAKKLGSSDALTDVDEA